MATTTDISAHPDSNPEKLRVLVVDDEKNIRQTLGLFLEKLGCEVHLASTGEAALRRAQPSADGAGLRRPAPGR